MPIDVLPNRLSVPTRDLLVQQYLRDIQLRAPLVPIGNGLMPNVDAPIISDMLLPVYAEAVRQADQATLDGKTTIAQLNQECIDSGLPTQLPAAGASGFVTVDASITGGFIQAGQEIRNLVTGLRYQATVAGVYALGSLCPIVGIDVGPNTNVSAGTVLSWTSPPPGINGTATVYLEQDGTGLSGGRNAETTDEMRTRIRSARAAPAVSGNDAAYQLAAQQTPGAAVQAAFTYPAILGPGTSCLVFLLRPSQQGGSRIPNNAQIGLVKGYVVGQMPKDDSVSFGTVIPQPTAVTLTVKWATGVASWTDAVPWPPTSGATYPYVVNAGSTAVSIIVQTTDPTPASPQVGQTFGLFDVANQRFVRKKILSVTGSNPWTLTFDTTNNSSDTTFTPSTGDQAVPWSDSLSLLIGPIQSYFDAMGPGEQVNTFLTPFFDAGYRQKRNPPDPLSWPSSLTAKALVPILQLSAVQNASIVSPALPATPTAGTPYVSAYLLTLSRLYVYPG